MLPGRALAARFVRQNETEIVCQNVWLERTADLRAAEYACDLRSDQGFVARLSPNISNASIAILSLEHVESGAQGKSVRRLEPERRTQNNHLRLFTPRQEEPTVSTPVRWTEVENCLKKKKR